MIMLNKLAAITATALEWGQAIREYAAMLDDVLLDARVFAGFSIVIILAFIVRLAILLIIENSESEGKSKLSNSGSAFIVGHVLIEFLIGYVITYSLIKMTGARWDNLIVNLIISPAIGVVGSIFVDIKFIVPFKPMALTAKKSKDSETKKEEARVTNVINVGVTDINDSVKAPKAKSAKAKAPEVTKLDESIATSEKFNEKIVEAVNSIIDLQQSQKTQIDENSEKLSESVIILDNIRKSAVIDKKIELKSMMYECLDQGYATPKQHDKISNLYHAYTDLLKGNGEVKELYKYHYSKLQIHEDRRSSDLEVPEKHLTQRIKYGQYDTNPQAAHQ